MICVINQNCIIDGIKYPKGAVVNSLLVPEHLIKRIISGSETVNKESDD